MTSISHVNTMALARVTPDENGSQLLNYSAFLSDTNVNILNGLPTVLIQKVQHSRKSTIKTVTLF